MSNLCDDTTLQQLLAKIETDNTNDIEYIDSILSNYPEDYRLHFMKGSILAEQQKPIEAHASLSKAVELEPEFILARYQLGFFELTSGEAGKALSTWGPLLSLPKENYIRIFVEGLTHLIRDEFDDAIRLMRQGIEMNEDNIPLNNDIHLLITECENLMNNNSHNQDSETNIDEQQSATSLILNQFSAGDTKH